MVTHTEPNATTNCHSCGLSLPIKRSIRLRGGLIVCADIVLCSTYSYLKKRDAMSEETKSNGGAFIRKAKAIVADTFNNDFPIDTLTIEPTSEDFYVVWFVKVLGNWKALLSTDIVSGHYWEVTYDGNKQQTYVDKYLKVENVVVTDETYSLIDPLA